MTALALSPITTTELTSSSVVAQDVALVPPHNLDTEAVVISGVLLDRSALGKIEDFLLPEHFYSEAHRRIYEAALCVKTQGSAVDTETVAARLKDTGRLSQVGGPAYISSILDATPAPANVRDHAAIVFERWRVRRTIEICERAAIYGHGVADAQSYVDSVVSRVAEIARQSPGKKAESNFDVLRRIVRSLREGLSDRPNSAKRGLPTGIRGIDDLTLGLFAGQKTTIVAPPRVGKTTLALQIAMNVTRLGVAVGFWSTEMDRDELGVCQLANLARVDSKRIQQAFQEPTLSAEEWQRIAMAMSEQGKIKSLLHVFDDSEPTVDDICAQATSLAEQSLALTGKPLGLAVVDYTQRLKPARSVVKENPYGQIKYSTERLKWLAKHLKIPVIELAQSKGGDVDKAKGYRPRPQLFDAAECKQIERSADRVVHLWRPREADGSRVTAVFVKVRGGEEGDVDLRLKGAFSLFEDEHFPSDDGVPYEKGEFYAQRPAPPPEPARTEAPEPPPGRFEDDEDTGSETLTGGL